MPKLSVLVPVYNARLYIGRLAHSLMRQTMLTDVEFIFVDDVSPDDSVSILESVVDQYPDRKKQVRIIRHEKNKGVATARNTALDAAQGKYICCCDNDDWVEPDYCSSLVEKAEVSGADLVVCDFFHDFEDHNVQETYPEFDSYQELVDYQGNNSWYVFTRLVRRSLLLENNVRWYDGLDMGEDMGVTVRWHYFSRRTVYLHRPLYHYNRINQNSIIHLNEKINSDKQYIYAKQLLKCVENLSVFLEQNNISSKLFSLKTQENIVFTSILQTRCFDVLNASFWRVVPIVMGRKDITLRFRIVLSCALCGFSIPLKMYLFLEKSKRSFYKHVS